MEQEIENLQKFYNLIIEFVVNYSFQIIGAVIILIIGFWLAKKISLIVEEFLINKNLDITLTKFIATTIKLLIIILFLIISLGKVGITVTPFVAAIGAMSLGAGLALQGMLSNYGAGIALIATRPFIVGNTITIGDYSGVVKDIKLGYTTLITEDTEEITIPNKEIVGQILVNSFEYKVVESVVGIDYNDDPKLAIDAIYKVLENNSEVSKEIKPMVGIKEFADASINIEYRYWAPTKKYNEMQYNINMEVYQAIMKNNITIPYPTYNIIRKG